MFTNRIELFTLLGFRVSLDLSWIVLAILITWSLATGYFPQAVEGIDANTSWWLGVGGALGLFASIIIHEFSHAYIARQFNLPIRGITLFIFGGVAEMEEEPPSARAEFFMAIAGPIASYFLAAFFYIIKGFFPEPSQAAPIGALFSYLSLINLVLATFNLVPAFPLDGGRVFRSAVWWLTGDIRRATRYAATAGRLFGMFLISLGVLSLVSGYFVTGMWQALIGLFIVGAANSSEMQMEMKLGLKGMRVDDIMVPDPISVPIDTSVEDLIENFFYRFHHKVFPVVTGDYLIGSVRLEDVGRVSRDQRSKMTVGDVISEDGLNRSVSSGTTIEDALDIMRDHNTSRLMVVDGRALRGILTMRDIVSYLAMRKELERGA